MRWYNSRRSFRVAKVGGLPDPAKGKLALAILSASCRLQAVHSPNPTVMKKLFFLASLLSICTAPLYAQVMGNYGVQQNTYQNVRVDARFRAVPRSATFVGDNVLEININDRM